MVKAFRIKILLAMIKDSQQIKKVKKSISLQKISSLRRFEQRNYRKFIYNFQFGLEIS